jgi:repressor LexA
MNALSPDHLFMKAPTDRQQAILAFMQKFLAKHAYWPSIRDIQAHFKFASTNAVHGHLQALERKGFIDRTAGAARAYRIHAAKADPDSLVIRFEGPGDDASEVDSVPVMGAIAAGFPDHTESSGVLDQLQVPVREGSRRRPPQTFALRVRGDSMIDAHIFDGDMVVIEPGQPKPGDIVAALIDGETTLKRLVRQGSKTFLKAENPAYPELYPVTELTVQGIARSVVRKI